MMDCFASARVVSRLRNTWFDVRFIITSTQMDNTRSSSSTPEPCTISSNHGDASKKSAGAAAQCSTNDETMEYSLALPDLSGIFAWHGGHVQDCDLDRRDPVILGGYLRGHLYQTTFALTLHVQQVASY